MNLWTAFCGGWTNTFDMQKSEIDTFFEKLAEKLGEPARIILTGGAASLLLGGSRPTQDIDFCLRTHEGSHVDKAIEEVKRSTEIGAQYSDDIDRWSAITFLDYDQHTIHYQSFGKIKVEILAPEYWSIGKMTRFYDSDIDDMIAVFKKQKTKIADLIPLWHRALKNSPRSNVQIQFKKQVAYFIKTFGKNIWGKSFAAKSWLEKWEES